MKRQLLILTLATVAAFAAATPAARAQNGCGYGGCWDGGYGWLYNTLRYEVPHFAAFPPVYYSAPVPRTYGYSPFAYPPNVMTPEMRGRRRAEFRPSPEVAALVAGGVVAAVTTQVVGQFLVAGGRTAALTLVWSLGLVTAVVVLAVSSLEPLTRVALAFALGELVALTAMWRVSRSVPVQEVSQNGR